MENNLIGDDLEILNVKKKISKGLSVLLFREFILKVFSFAGQIILARILFPSDFGTIAIIAFIVNFFTLFIDIGLSPAIIREKKKPTQKQLSTIFYIKFFLALISILVIFIISPIIIQFINGFGSENLLMIYVYGASLIFTSIKSVPVALIERELKFDLVSKIDIIGVVSYQISIVLFAVFGLGVWSFILSIYIKEIVECVVIYKNCPWRPNLYFNKKKIQNMINFGIFMQGGGIINFFQNSVIPVIGGIKTTPYQVGLLDWAYGNALIPEAITNNFGRVAFSGFSKIQHNKEALSDTISKSIKLLLIANVFFVVIVLGFGAEIVEIIYTSKWLPGIHALYWFSASMIFMPFIAVYAQGIFALGKSKIYFKFNLICAVFEWILAIILVERIGFEGIAVSFFIFAALLTISSYIIAKREKISGEFLKNCLVIIAYLPISLIFAYLLNQLIPFSIVGLILKITIISAIYLIITTIIAGNELKYVLDEIKENFKNK